MKRELHPVEGVGVGGSCITAMHMTSCIILEGPVSHCHICVGRCIILTSMKRETYQTKNMFICIILIKYSKGSVRVEGGRCGSE